MQITIKLKTVTQNVTAKNESITYFINIYIYKLLKLHIIKLYIFYKKEEQIYCFLKRCAHIFFRL
jgi:hypothetical protein